MSQPLYIALEGVEGCGKSTQARLLADRLGAVLTREPGGTPMGSMVRQILLSPATGELEPMAEVLLFNADRVQHLHEVVLPALQAGQPVVSDRSYVSNCVYQGHARGLGADYVRSVCSLVVTELFPHRIFVLDVDLADSMARISARGGELDRFEQEGAEFHAKLVEGFRIEAQKGLPGQFVFIDGRGSVEEVQQSIWAHVEPLQAA